MRFYFLISLFIAIIAITASCRRADLEYVTIALPDKFSTLDTLTTTASDSAAERVRTLLFNTLVKKNDSFEYVGELAKDIVTSDDGKTITLTLQENVKFHNGNPFTSADVKYTFDELFKSNGYKAGAFFDTVNGDRVPHITSLETPGPHSVVFTVGRPALKNQLLSNLVAIPIIPQGTSELQKESPVGSGPFKFVALDSSQNILELASNADYWEGAPKILKVRLKTITDASSLQAELQTGAVDLAPNPSNLPPDILKALSDQPTLKVEQFPGSNIQYLGLNTQAAPLNKVKVRQAIAFAVDREKLINELLYGQAALAHSILPPESWAYTAGTKYNYDPEKARQLLKEAGYKNEPITFKYSSGNNAVNQYAQVIQSSLKDVGLNVQIEQLEPGTLRTQLAQGQFQMNTGVWIGGNQDPIFLKDLFTTGRIPGGTVSCCNRSRYSNPDVDKTIEEAINTLDREQAKQLYTKAWEMISNDMPLLPLWYPANMVVANTRIGNIKISASGDWRFVKDITVQ
ncbi:MAG: ABC transporter substrate-binding protein [Pyrinomonadaceae bacterium]